MSKQFVITGIGTDVGKTVVSSIVAEALKASYWKPIQAGDLENSDSIRVGQLTSTVTILPEAYRLMEPMSPHAAAKIDGVAIPATIDLPAVEGNLIVEGAGGLMVPINQEGSSFLDLMKHWQLPVIVVSRHYLGSINHSLLTVEVLQHHGVNIAGIIFVGDKNEATESIILATAGLKMIARIPMVEVVDAAFIQLEASRIHL